MPGNPNQMLMAMRAILATPPRATRIPLLMGGEQRIRTWRRISAACADLFVYAICLFVWYAVISRIVVDGQADASERLTTVWTTVVLLSGWVLIAVISEILILVRFGRTLGKRLFGLMVVDAGSGHDAISTRQAVIRTLIKGMIFYGASMGLSWQFERLAPGVLQMALATTSAVFVISFLGILRQDGRAVHDLIAKTALVRT